MPRMSRLELAGIPMHVVQRGNDRQACFRADADRRRYLEYVREAAARCGCAVHAYALMTNHVHLLLTPHEAGATSVMMQTLGRRYVAAFNLRYARTGTLWEGRFRSSLVGSASYVLACYRYIELNPVRAGIVGSAGDYSWTSYGANALGRDDPLITPHDAYVALNDGSGRTDAYRQLVAAALDERELLEIRAHLQQGRAYGPESFRIDIEARLERCVRLRGRGHQPAAPADAERLARRILRK